MQLETFIDYYLPLDSEQKIDRLFELCFKIMHKPICANDFSKILSVTSEGIKPYLLEKKVEYDNYIVQLENAKKQRKKKKKKAGKRGRRSSSPFNKGEIVYKRIHIISTPM